GSATRGTAIGGGQSPAWWTLVPCFSTWARSALVDARRATVPTSVSRLWTDGDAAAMKPDAAVARGMRMGSAMRNVTVRPTGRAHRRHRYRPPAQCGRRALARTQ